MATLQSVLVVDDEEALRSVLTELLEGLGYQVRVAARGAEALSLLERERFDAVLLDVVLPDLSGLNVLETYRRQGGSTPVIVLSALRSAEDAVRAMKLGATDYLTKPFDRNELVSSLTRATGDARIVGAASSSEMSTGEADKFASALFERDEERPSIFVSEAMQRVHALVERIADTDVPVLLLGESGTGKEVISRELHGCSRRSERPFIKVNCAALPGELLESELFGHEKGAFTGATAEKPGKFELADKGTIFLDEIGEMDVRLQAKLLQVLQDEDFFRVGGKRSVRVDSRVVVATNRDLEFEISQGRFREDLFYRLNVVAIRIPPLRERREDVLPLVDHFLRKYGRRYRQLPPEMSAPIRQLFMHHEWPGNVRELENTVRRMVVLDDADVVAEELRASGRGEVRRRRESELGFGENEGAWREAMASGGVGAALEAAFGAFTPMPLSASVGEGASSEASVNEVSGSSPYTNPFLMPQPPPPPPHLPESEMSLKDIGKRAAMLAEREAILAMLQRTAWNKRKAASKLRISYKALLYKIKESGIIDPRDAAEF